MQRHVEESGDAWFGLTRWRGVAAARFSVSSWATTDDDIERTLRAVERGVAAAVREPETALQ